MKKPKLLIVDGHSILYRAYHGTQQVLTLPDGRIVTAVYTFVRTLLRFLEYTRPEYLVITFDTKGKNFRHELYQDYKAHRSPMPDDLALQIPILQELLVASEIKILRKEGVEADDLIGTLSAKAKAEGLFTYVLSGDRDDLQLVDEEVYLLYPQKQGLFKEYTPDLFLEEYQFPTDDFVMYKAIVGDSSDNIPGIAGLGPVAATKLVKAFKTLERLYAYVDEKCALYKDVEYKKIPFSAEEKEKGVQASSFQKLEQGREQAFLSLALSKIDREVDVDIDFEACKLPRFELTAFYEKLKAFAFRSLHDQFHQFEEEMGALLADRKNRAGEKKEEAIQENQSQAYRIEGFTYSEDVSKLQQFLKQLKIEKVKAEDYAFYILRSSLEEDVLTRRWKAEKKEKVLWQSEHHLPPYLLCYYEPVVDTETKDVFQAEEAVASKKFLDIGKKTSKISKHYHLHVWGLSASSLEKVLDLLAQEPVDLCFDSLKPYLKHLAFPERLKDFALLKEQKAFKLNSLSLLDYSLGHLRPNESLQEILLNQGEDERLNFNHLNLTYLKEEFLSFDEDEAVKKIFFNEKDVYILSLCLYFKQLKDEALQQLQLQENMKNLVYQVDLPLQVVVAEMELKGISIDTQKLLEMKQEFEEKIQVLEREILSYAKEPFNIQSTKQLSQFLFEELNLPKTKKRTSGYSTAQEDLDDLEALHPVIALLKEYRYYTKLLATFILGLLSYIEEDGRIRTTLELEKTSTGRLSSVNPNLQNIPVKQEIGRKIREVFGASKGKRLLVADYSQIELRFLAHLSKDQAMIESFIEGKDIHRLTAEGLFPHQEELGFYERQVAKTINFSVMYGISEFSLSKDLGISFKEAKEYINAYYRRYPSVAQFMEQLIHQAEQKGYSETMLGRRRFIEEFKSKNAHVRQFAERVAMNAPIQGSAADLIRMAMVRVAEAIKAQGLEADLLLQIHDELIVEVAEQDIEKAKILLKTAMEEAISLSVPLVADVKVVQHWGESK